MDSATVEESFDDTNKVNVSLDTRTGLVRDCVILGSWKPQKGTKGIIFYSGRFKYPYFFPFFSGVSVVNETGSTKIGIQDGVASIDRTGWINFKDYAKQYLAEDKIDERGDSPYDEQWGNPEAIKGIVSLALDYYLVNNGSDAIIVGDIGKIADVRPNGTYGKHRGIGHSSGRAVDIYMRSGIQNASGRKESDLPKLKQFFDLCKKHGVTGVLHNDDKFKQIFDGFVVEDKHDGHYSHFHVVFTKRNQGEGF